MRAAVLASILAASGSSTPAPPVRYVDETTQRLYFDGNSFLTGVTFNVGTAVRATTLGALFPGFVNIGIGGQSWRSMRGIEDSGSTPGDTVDRAAMLAGGAGCLVLVETTNSVFNSGHTAADTLAQITEYCAEVRAVQPNIPIIVVGTIPRHENPNFQASQTYASHVEANAAMSAVDAALAASPSTYGADGFVSLRAAGSPYAFSDYNLTTFQAAAAWYADTYVHPSSAGRDYIAEQIAAKLAAMRSPAALPFERWSDPATWSGAVPTSGPVVIPANKSVLLDVSTAGLGTLTINGTLSADPAVDVGITAANIVVGANGALRVGSAAQRYTRNCTITLTGAENARAARFVPQHDNPVAGKGKPARLAVGTGVAAGEMITLTFTSTNTFSASSSTAGAMPSGTVGTYYSSRVQFMPTSGATPWVAGDTVIISIGPQMGFTNDGVGRSLAVQPGGRLQLFGAIKTGSAVLNASAASGATALTLAATPTGWNAGDSVVVGPTDFQGTASGTPHVTTLAASVSAAACTLSAGLNASRWGVLQYPTDTGISLSQGAFTPDGMKASVDVPAVIDQRARIINKTRNIVIQGADDAAWSTSKFGAHCMVMGLSSVAQIDGVEFRRMGQAGAIGRYPIHWHMLSYGGQHGGDVARLPSDGTFLGAIPAGNAYLRNCSVHTSGQRGTVIHGTHGVEVSGNTYHDITAHCIFLEDNAEQGNTIRDNTIIGVSEPSPANRLLMHEEVTPQATPYSSAFSGSAGIWFSNPANTLENNCVASAAIGIWNAFSPVPVGLCSEVAVSPFKLRLTSHDNNYAIGCGLFGMSTRFYAQDSRGSLGGDEYQHFAEDGVTKGPAVITRAQIYKCLKGGYLNAVARPTYRQWTIGDNGVMCFNGRVEGGGFIEHCLGFGSSLNNANMPPTGDYYGPQAFMASYHFTLVPRYCSAFNFPLASSTVLGGNVHEMYVGGGLTRTDDFYTDAIEQGLAGAVGLKLHNTAAGWFTPPADLDGRSTVRGWTLAGALQDYQGLWGPAGNYVIRGYPFLTHGLSASAVALVGQAGYSTPDVFMGVGYAMYDSTSPTTGPYIADEQTVERLDGSGAVVGTWHTAAAGPSGLNFHHFSAQSGGVYRWTWAGRALPTSARFNVTNGYRAGTSAVFGVPFGGTTLSHAFRVPNDYVDALTFSALPAYAQAYSESLAIVSSRSALDASTVPAAFLDVPNQRVWIKHIGGYSAPAYGDGLDKISQAKSTWYRITA
jgi:hypothetical protein